MPIFAPRATSDPEHSTLNIMRRRAIAVTAIVLVSLLAACQSTQPTTPQGKGYKSIATCNATAQGLVKSFGMVYQTNKATDPVLWGQRYDKVQAAYQAYQKIALSAVDAAQAGGDSQLILAAVNEALNQLTILLATFGVK